MGKVRPTNGEVWCDRWGSLVRQIGKKKEGWCDKRGSSSPTNREVGWFLRQIGSVRTTDGEVVLRCENLVFVSVGAVGWGSGVFFAPSQVADGQWLARVRRQKSRFFACMEIVKVRHSRNICMIFKLLSVNFSEERREQMGEPSDEFLPWRAPLVPCLWGELERTCLLSLIERV